MTDLDWLTYKEMPRCPVTGNGSTLVRPGTIGVLVVAQAVPLLPFVNERMVGMVISVDVEDGC